MERSKYKKYTFYSFLILLTILVFYFFIINDLKNEKKLTLTPISINLLTSVHPELSWIFKPVKSKIVIQPGEVKTVEYIVKSSAKEKSTGIATFDYYPKEFGVYINKINCFCYDAKTLKPNEESKFILVILVDPEVTKDSKTKNIKEATIQFTFFDYKKYKEEKS